MQALQHISRKLGEEGKEEEEEEEEGELKRMM